MQSVMASICLVKNCWAVRACPIIIRSTVVITKLVHDNTLPTNYITHLTRFKIKRKPNVLAMLMTAFLRTGPEQERGNKFRERLTSQLHMVHNLSLSQECYLFPLPMRKAIVGLAETSGFCFILALVVKFVT